MIYWAAMHSLGCDGPQKLMGLGGKEARTIGRLMRDNRMRWGESGGLG